MMIRPSGYCRWQVALSLVALASGCSTLVDRIPPAAATDGAMSETFVRIERYVDAHGQLPPDLSVLPARQGYANSVTDGWGGTLLYGVDKNGEVVLTSLGADGKPGGEGPNQDTVRRCRIRKPGGPCNVDDDSGIPHTDGKQARF